MRKVTINSFGIEFGYEMLSALPYAYFLHTEGLLEKTLSVKDTRELYYFSENHEERDTQRSRYNMPEALQAEIPNIYIYLESLDWSRFKAPPYKEKFKNEQFYFDKPILVISNKYNVEWSDKPYNYLDIPTLRRLFRLLRQDYQVIYNRMTKEMGYDDHAESLDLGEFEMIENEFPEVLTIQQLLKENPYLTYNGLQLRLYTNCEKFISVQGGSSVLASFFGGQNIIYTVKGQELECGSYWKWYYKISGCKVTVNTNYDQLLDVVSRNYLGKKKTYFPRKITHPVVNVLVRTSNRPRFFEKCYKSIRSQYYRNINLIVSCDDKETRQYVSSYAIDTIVGFKRSEETEAVKKVFVPENPSKPFPANEYFNEMMDKTNEGFIIYLDDDDIFTCPEAVSTIVEQIDHEDQMIFWRVQFPGYLVPDDKYFGKPPVCCQIDTASFAFHTRYKRFALWDAFSLGDFRTALSLFLRIPEKIYINKALTALQSKPGLGKRKDLPIEKLTKSEV
jgi:hypothetical protein